MPLPTPQDLLYMKEHITDDRGPQLKAALAVNFALACIAVILRLASRYISKSPLLADDYNVIVAMVRMSITRELCHALTQVDHCDCSVRGQHDW